MQEADRAALLAEMRDLQGQVTIDGASGCGQGTLSAMQWNWKGHDQNANLLIGEHMHAVQGQAIHKSQRLRNMFESRLRGVQCGCDGIGAFRIPGR